MTAPGRYCLAVCYCGECDHYVPIVRHRDRTGSKQIPKAEREPFAPSREPIDRQIVMLPKLEGEAS